MEPCSNARRDDKRIHPKPKTLRSLLFGALFFAHGCSEAPPILMSCEDSMGIHAVCGLQNPEDLALLPDGDHVIVSQFGLMDGSQSGT